MTLTSDPHAWLRPFYRRLRVAPAFAQFAPAHQFAQLCEVVGAEHPAKAAQMREWSVAAQHAENRKRGGGTSIPAGGNAEGIMIVYAVDRE